MMQRLERGLRWRLQSFERATLDEEQAEERLYAHDVSESQQSEKRQENQKQYHGGGDDLFRCSTSDGSQ